MSALLVITTPAIISTLYPIEAKGDTLAADGLTWQTVPPQYPSLEWFFFEFDRNQDCPG